MFKKSGLEVYQLHRGGVCQRSFTASLQSPIRHQCFSQYRRENIRHEPTTPIGIPAGLTPDELESQLELENAADVLRRVFLGPKAVYRSRSINQRMYNFHFNTPEKLKNYREQRYKDTSTDRNEELDTNGPRYYRLRGLPNALSMELVRSQLRSCLAPEDFTIVVAAVLKHKMGPEILANPSLQLLLQKWLVDRLDSARVLEFLSLFVARLERAGLKCEIGLIWSALIAAAECHCTMAIRKYLKKWCTYNNDSVRIMDKDEFMKLLVALRAGSLQPGEGKTLNRDAMIEIMFGFSDPAFRGPYHLSKHMPHQQWDALVPWIEILVELNTGERIWDAWKLVRKREPDVWAKWGKQVNSSNTGSWKFYPPRVFILALFKTGQPERAWQVFRRGGAGIRDWDHEVWDLLHEYAALKGDLDAPLQQKVEKGFVAKLAKDLYNLEQDLGLVWIPPDNEHSEGYHKAVAYEEVLETLSSKPHAKQELPVERKPRKAKLEGKIFHNNAKQLKKRERKELERSESMRPNVT